MILFLTKKDFVPTADFSKPTSLITSVKFSLHESVLQADTILYVEPLPNGADYQVTILKNRTGFAASFVSISEETNLQTIIGEFARLKITV